MDDNLKKVLQVKETMGEIRMKKKGISIKER